MKDLKILVLEGGYNEEHEVSIATSKEVKKALKNLSIEYQSVLVNPNTFEKDIAKFSQDYICFNALHGSFGEDGKIQKILEKASYIFTHASSKASHIGFNKKLTKDIIKNMPILTPDYLTINNDQINEIFFFETFSRLGSFIIKPISSGSSFGIKIFRNINDIKNFIKNFKNNLDIYKNHKELLIEKYIEGRELTVGIFEKNKESIPIEVTEIITNNDFFDYASKYTPGFAEHILPANIPIDIYKKCKKFAKIIHDKIKCKGVSRSDFIYSNNKLYFLEINSQPGLTSISLVPEQLKYQNISFDDLICRIIKCAL